MVFCSLQGEKQHNLKTMERFQVRFETDSDGFGLVIQWG